MTITHQAATFLKQGHDALRSLALRLIKINPPQ